MRFKDHLLLQKQHAEEQERHVIAQKILDEASVTIQSVYLSRKRYRDPIEESKARIKTLQRRAASASAGASQQIAQDTFVRTAGIAGGNQSLALNSQQQPDYVQREVTVRHLNDHANLNPTAFKLYRKLRFG